jgi:predicted nucleic acid-binding protein
LARGIELQQQGLGAEDALHLAIAEQAHAEWFITTDDRLLRRTANRTQPPQSINPVDWLRRRQLWLVPKP